MTSAVLALPEVLDPMYWLGDGGPFAAALLPGVVVIVFLETGLFIPFLPGDTLLITAGLLAAQPNAPVGPWTLGAAAAASAVVGGQLGYAIGRRLGPALFTDDDARFLKKRYLASSRAFFERHGRKTVVLGHFVGVVRTFMPVIAGASRMRYPVFLAFDVVGACAWGFGVTALGYYLGAVPAVSAHLEFIVLAVAVLSGAPVAVSAGRALLQNRRAAPDGYRGVMASTPGTTPNDDRADDRIDEVAAGDLVDLDRGAGPRPHKVVHTDRTTLDGAPGVLVTFEGDDGETFEAEYAADTRVRRSLESKWESEQSGERTDTR